MADATPSSQPSALRRYGFCLLLTAAATVARVLTMAYTGPRLTFLTFLIAVILSGWYGGLGPALLAGTLGTVLGTRYAPNLDLTPPGGYVIVSLIIAFVMHAQRTSKQRLEAETAERQR